MRRILLAALVVGLCVSQSGCMAAVMAANIAAAGAISSAAETNLKDNDPDTYCAQMDNHYKQFCTDYYANKAAARSQPASMTH